MNLMCGSHEYWLLSELSVERRISILSHIVTTLPHFLSSPPPSTVASISPTANPYAHHHLMMTTAQLKTSLGPGCHGNALRRQAGRGPIGLGFGLVGGTMLSWHPATSPHSFGRPRTPSHAATPHYSKPPRVVKWKSSCLQGRVTLVPLGGAGTDPTTKAK